MKRWIWAALLVLSVLLASGSRPLLADDDSSQPLVSVADLHNLGFALRWGTDVGVPSDQQIVFVELLDDVLVTLESPSNMLTAISVSDGRILWRHVATTSAANLFAPFRSPSRKEININGQLIALNKLVMVNSENEIHLFAINDGRGLGTIDLPVAVDNAPAIADNYAIFGGADGTVFAIDLVSGFKRWAYRLPAAVVARPVIVKPDAFVADISGIYATIVAYPFSVEDEPGALRWRGRTFDKIDVPPAVNDQGIYLASEDQSLYSLNRVDGSDRWIYRAGEPLHLSPVTLEDSLYLPLSSGSLVSIDPATGNQLWTFPHLAKPVMLQDQRLILSGGSVLWALDNRTGKPTQEVQVQPLRAVLSGDHNCLLLVTPAGRIQRLDPES